ncbi:type II secretion system F family protein [Yersinia massiliensis]|uniref:Tight adherance operon protein n=1 Tax=Yersinia massiliensis TaxID=419257 RepID=A0ABM6UPM6_9GAMM|nr:type II secretion system F family protein [Yersinia massiliensis]AVX36709.1 tight adherance operon protein [Yersinia massiliensis]QKJ11509.1 type II secretion system F family protein [Yersinia massiliensis]
MKIALIIIILFFISLFFTKKAKSNKISVYYKIISREKIDNEKEHKHQEKKLSNFINLPFILHNITYFKILIIATAIVISILFIATDIISINLNTLMIIGLITVAMMITLPKIIISNYINKRTTSILRTLPFFIDITAACVQSGMTIDSSLSYTAKKFQVINTDLSSIISNMNKRAEINGLDSAIKELHQSSTATEIRMLCSTLQYSISFGSTVYDQLIQLSQDIREMQLLITEEKISKLSTKLTIPLFIFILIPFVVLVISPSVLELITYVQNN